MENHELIQTKSQLTFEKMQSIFHKYHKIEIIAALHWLITTSGLFLTIEDIFVQHYPSSLHEVAVVFFFYSVHYGLIALLVIGHKKQLPIFYLPWIIVTNIPLTYVTYLWIENISKYGMFYEVSAFYINLVVLGICWLCWTIVFFNFVSCFYILRKNKEISNNNKIVKAI